MRGRRDVRAVCKPAASLAFVAYAVTAGAAAAGTPGILVLCALVLSLVGDVALLGTDRRAIGAGLAAFGLAHLGYAAAFTSLGVATVPAVVAAVVLGLPAAAVWRRLKPGLGGLAPAVLAYIAVISLMVAAAAGSLGYASTAGGTGVRGALLACAIAFYLSDLCVARERFVVHDVRNKLAGLPLYYGAQVGFAGLIGQVP